jgi:hypothetical protein
MPAPDSSVLKVDFMAALLLVVGSIAPRPRLGRRAQA